jgi:hypothetical protein
MVNSSRCVHPVTGASNKKKKSAAIAVTSASTVGRQIHGIRPIAENEILRVAGPGGISKKFNVGEMRPAPHLTFAKLLKTRKMANRF